MHHVEHDRSKLPVTLWLTSLLLLLPVPAALSQSAAASGVEAAVSEEAGEAPEPLVYPFDTNHSTVGFAVDIMGLSRVTGKFWDWDGHLLLTDPEDLTTARIEVVIRAESIDTGIDDRDEHLRSEDFFEVETYPEILFTSDRVERSGTGYRVIGDFTMHGVTRELVIPFELTGRRKGMGARARIDLDRQDYGIRWSRVMDDGALFVSDDVEVLLDLLTRAPVSLEEWRERQAEGETGGADR